jgi:membrane fusion protein, multidrug efflux system
VETVVARALRESDEFNGRLSAIETVVLRPRVSGYIERVAYKEGAEVQRGDLLFVIDPRFYRDALESARSELERARAALELAHLQEQRAQTLIEAKAISREEFDIRRADVTQGTSAVRKAEAALATAALNLSFTEVRAAISGRAGRAMLTAGNLAQADQTELTTIVPLDPMYVYFDCDEHTYLRYIEMKRRPGQPGVAGAVHIALADESGFAHVATLDFLDNQVDAATGTIRARAVLPNPDREFTAGLYARVRLEIGEETRALLVDDKAVLTDQDRRFVYVVGTDDRAVRKDVVLGRAVDGMRVVQSGLEASDRVIVSGLQAVLFPGMPVKPIRSNARSAAAVEHRLSMAPVVK